MTEITLKMIVFQAAFSFIGSWGYSIICNAPRRELLYSGINGFLSWFVYMLVLSYTESATTATLIATMAITATARFLSYHRQEPSILYQIPGVLSLVPGAAVYNTMQAAIKGNILSTYSNALTGFKLSGAIAIGSLIILVLPYKSSLVSEKRNKIIDRIKKPEALKSFRFLSLIRNLLQCHGFLRGCEGIDCHTAAAQIKDFHFAVVFAVHAAQIGILFQHGNFCFPAVIPHHIAVDANPCAVGMHSTYFCQRVFFQLAIYFFGISSHKIYVILVQSHSTKRTHTGLVALTCCQIKNFTFSQIFHRIFHTSTAFLLFFYVYDFIIFCYDRKHKYDFFLYLV